MSTAQVVVTVVVVVAVVVVALLVVSVLRRRRLQQRFGPEYERLVTEQPNRAAAEHELRAREKRYASLELTPLSDEQRDHYAREWTQVQAGFVDNPGQSVNSADALVTQVMAARGYPINGFDDRVETLSVENAKTVDNYRQAHDIAQANLLGQASTEQLRQAVVHYRTLAGVLLDIDNGASTPERVERDDVATPERTATRDPQTMNEVS